MSSTDPVYIYCKKWRFGRVSRMPHWLTTLKDRATQLLIKYKSGALVTQFKLCAWILVFSYIFIFKGRNNDIKNFRIWLQECCAHHEKVLPRQSFREAWLPKGWTNHFSNNVSSFITQSEATPQYFSSVPQRSKSHRHQSNKTKTSPRNLESPKVISNICGKDTISREELKCWLDWSHALFDCFFLRK